MNAKALYPPLIPLTLTLFLTAWSVQAAFPTHTLFTYQGYFTDNDKPANGVYDLSFRLLGDQYDVVAGGGPRWSNTDFLRPAAGWIVEDVLVKNGQFQVEIDFGPAVVYDGSVRFLEVAVRPGASTGEFRMLAPPHRLLPVPKALHANTAGAVTGLLSISNLPPSVAWLDLPQVFTAPPTFNPPSGAPFVVGVTTTVQKLSADLLDGLDSSAFWRRATNDGVSSIVEPTDQAIEIRVPSSRVLRLQKGDSNLGWSVIGGSAGNTVATGVPGAVVGGGRGNLIETGAHYSSVLGGDGNAVDTNARDSVIGGGTRQLIGPNSINAGVFAGYHNVVSSNSRFAGVLLGNNGTVRENSDFSAIVSGGDNTIGPATYSVILAGGANRIESGANLSLIASGQQNTISTQAYASAIVAGQLNSIQPGARRAFLGGGDYNEIGRESYNAFLGGGGRNQIQFNAPYSAILGGNLNLVRSNAGWATVLGGVESVAGAPFAIAAGHGAKAEHPGSIVLADGQYASFVSSNANEFAVRASGGVRFETGGRGVWVDGEKLVAVDPGGGGAGSNAITAPFTLTGDEPGRAILRGVNESSTLLSTAVRGEATATTGATIGVFGLNGSSEGTAVYGLASRSTGVNYAVRGETESAEGYAGYFEGRVHIQGGTDVEPQAGGFVQIGASTGANLALDDNELMARNNGESATLYLNDDGGNILLARNGTGRIGIGTGAPTVKLDVNGEIRCVALTLTSSRRFKTDIVSLEHALERVNALRGVTYRWDQAHGGQADVGFVAEEVEPVLPEAVVREPDGQNVAGIKADRLTALTLEAVKELHQVVKAKDAEIAGLRARLAEIERRLGLVDQSTQLGAAVGRP